MLLAIDVGNTQTVLGLFEGDALRASWRLHSDRSRTADELGLMVHDLLERDGHDTATIDGAVVGSVVPPLTGTVREMLRRVLKTPPLVVDHTVVLPLRLAVREPSQLGADRIANAVAARALHGTPVIVVDLGTATTFDVVSEDGAYLGGVIAPGPMASQESLVGRTSRLTRVDLVAPQAVIGRTTEEAMRSGLMWGTAAAIDGIVRLIWRELGGRSRVIATGGDAPGIIALTETVGTVEPELTLVGLRLVYEANS